MRLAVTFHPASDPPAFAIDLALPGDWPTLSGEVVECSPFHGLADQPVDELFLRFEATHTHMVRNASGRQDMLITPALVKGSS